MIRGLHPELKKRLKAAFVQLLENPHCGKILREELAGLRSLRVKKMRIIYRLSAKGDITVVTLGPRKTIYEETFRLINRESR
ncbi:MAG: type II toxin-antitoxin system RelE/ParE family toxin [Desulfurivibrio sp.]|nr:type II toxin-antitoxin system RelE/ParE family toxin [Desulfurivibrio sp.]